MSGSTVQEDRCAMCGLPVVRRGPGKWAVYHRDAALGRVRGIPPHFPLVAS